LFIASDSIDESNIDRAYRDVLRLVAQLQTPYLDPFRVKLISGTDELALAAVQKRSTSRFRTRVGGGMFGGQSVDDVYLYPADDHASVP
jgi:hypothetical protein